MTHTRKEQVDQWREALKPKIQLIQRLNATDDGKALFDLLEQTFENRVLVGVDASETYYRLGQRDVVHYLRELREHKALKADEIGEEI